jgi:hypothetical protein
MPHVAVVNRSLRGTQAHAGGADSHARAEPEPLVVQAAALTNNKRAQQLASYGRAEPEPELGR